MFEFLIGYLLFSCAVGLQSYLTLYKPCINYIRDNKEKLFPDGNYPNDLSHKKLFFFIVVTISAITAPVMFWQALKGADQKFIDTYVAKSREFIKNNS